MSATGFWVVGAVPDPEISRIRRVHPDAAAAHGAAPAPSADLEWWRRQSASEVFFEEGPHCPAPTGAARRFADLVDAARSDSAAAEDMRDDLLRLVPQREGEGLFCAAARKGDPAAALAWALGPASAQHLPGRFGDFLLDAAQVQAVLPEARQALALEPARRAEVTARVGLWLDGMGDDAGHDAGKLIDGPLEVLRHAARTGSGAVGMALWY
ncbi:hypothetical protein LO771_19790 [Streptacidiphilus sp. ASG 303]|uniref:hypothetical protein n=1 Tax=Streptacidiphilus sp. ASG 303 TaxID=2896847 RepID=UPI001E57C41C|nr:hypothetical protein [Streptacidiphilus sp. ASG 303]MCD0484576.1 hypothetical protein [Streptacidiphilus sp. ASG 303]